MGLGSKDGLEEKNKLYFLFYSLALTIFLLFGSIGAPTDTKNVIYFYGLFVGAGFLLPFFWDQKSKTSEMLDTVTIEEPRNKIFGYGTQIIIGALISGYTIFRAVTTQKAWVNAPIFGVFTGVFGEALLSGIGGVMENWFFFGVFFPTLYLHLSKKMNKIPAFFLACLIVAPCFTAGHLWRYSGNEPALLSTFIFAFANCTFVFIFRSLIISEMLHFSNNIAVATGIAQKVGFQIFI